jgi:hypothetical protein
VEEAVNSRMRLTLLVTFILLAVCATTSYSFTMDYFIWDLDRNENSGPAMQSALTAAGYTGLRSDVLPDLSALLDHRTVWICAGMVPENEPLSTYPTEVDDLCQYLADHDSTCIYMEGGDVWNTDEPTPLRSYFKLARGSSGWSDLDSIRGEAWTFAEPMRFDYVGDNAFVDRLVIDSTSAAFYLFKNSNPVYGVMTGYDNGGCTYKTIASSCEFGGLADGAQDNTKAALAESIMTFFCVPKIVYSRDVAVLSIMSPPLLTPPNEPVVFVCQVKNVGLETSGGLYAHIRVDPGAYEESTFVPPLDPDSSALVYFSPEWIPGDAGTVYEICAWTSWGSDQRLANDSLCREVVSWDDRWYVRSTWCGNGHSVIPNGHIGAVEWADAEVRDVSDFLGRKSRQPPGMAMFYVMNDSFNLYIALDAVADGSNSDLDTWSMYFEDSYDRYWPLFPDSSEGGLRVINHPGPGPWFLYRPHFSDTFAVGYWVSVNGWCDNTAGHMQYECVIPIGDTVVAADTAGRHHSILNSLCDTVGFWMSASNEDAREIYAWWPTSSNVGYGKLDDMGMIVLHCGLERYFELGVERIVSPPMSVNMGQDYPVTVRVRNNGNFSESFQVIAIIGDSAAPAYLDSSWVTDLSPNATFDADFPMWHVPSIETSWTMCAWLDVSDSNTSNDTLCIVISSVTGVAELLSERGPSIFSLSQNAPNPFCSGTRIKYSLPTGEHVSISVFDLSGSKIACLMDGHLGPGSYVISWDGRDRAGHLVPGGVYFLRMDAGQFRATRKMLKVG